MDRDDDDGRMMRDGKSERTGRERTSKPSPEDMHESETAMIGRVNDRLPRVCMCLAIVLSLKACAWS